MTIFLVMHDAGPISDGNERRLWKDLAGAFRINFVFKVGGKQERGFAQYGPEHTMPAKKVCLLTPVEARQAKIEATSLHEYVHPESCQYIFGPDNAVRGWQKEIADEDTDYVTIPTPGGTELYSPLAAAFVLWHRLHQQR
jgi:hypothetical protein